MCQKCGARPGRVSVTRTFLNGQKQTESLCATCARSGELGIFRSLLDLGMVDGFPEDDFDLDEHIEGAPFEALMDACFSAHDDEDEDWMNSEDPFEDDDSGEDDERDPFGDDDEAPLESAPNLFQSQGAHEDEADALCAGCGASWEQIASDERAGCAKCYSTFRASLKALLEQVQREAKHFGKTPRTAQKRRMRLEHLRARRDHQLEMLRSRLAQAVQSERYEEAATLRDKIKEVSSSLF